MDDDTLISTQTELETHILSFYRMLYTRGEQVEANAIAIQDCLQYLKQIVTTEYNEELLKPLTLEKVATAMKQRHAAKSPKVDSIPTELYQEMWEDIEFDIFNFVSESIREECILEELNICK